MAQIICLGLGSLAGGFARYYLTGALERSLGHAFPYGTLAVNLIGCFLIGFLGALAGDKFHLSPEARLLLMTGFCGAFTTFSAFMMEADHLVKAGDFYRAMLYVVVSVAAGFAFYRAGLLVGARL